MMITMIKIMLQIKIIKILKIIKKIESIWMIILRIRITITTNKTLITNKILTGGKNQTIILIFNILTMKKLPCISSVKPHVHQDQKGHMSFIYGTCTILFAIKIFPFQDGLLLWSP